MVLAQLVDDNKEIFARPRTVQEILRGREPIQVNRPEDLLEVAQYRERRPLLIYGFNIIPPEFFGAVNFGKRGPLVEIPTFNGNVQQLRDKEWSDLRARIGAWKQYKSSEEQYVGWTWVDPESKHHVLRPTTNVEGHRLHMHALKASSIEDKIEVKKSYGARDTGARSVPVLVPSRSHNKKHEIILNHLTNPDDPQRFVEWTRLDTNHFCAHKKWDRVTFRFADHGGTVNYCPHDVAAHVAYSRQVALQTRRIIPQPFPMMTEPYVRLAMTLLYNTVKVDIETKGGRVKTHTRPLVLQEADVWLMEAWKKFDNRHTLFVESPTKTYNRSPPESERRTMREYDWSTDGPSMPFRTG